MFKILNLNLMFFIIPMSDEEYSFTPDDDYQELYQQYYPTQVSAASDTNKIKVVRPQDIKPTGTTGQIKIVKPNSGIKVIGHNEKKEEQKPSKSSDFATGTKQKLGTKDAEQFKEITDKFVNLDLEIDEEFFKLKESLNIVFIGHVDAGKSTLGGQILIQSGMVDQRTLEKYQREAIEQNRESWYLAWALDLNQDERSKGITVEAGKAYFETENKKVIILDAPGHKNYIPNMIGAAQQADLGILVISARKGEFEAGFEKNGQTREHAILAKTAGLKSLLVVINKMDESTVRWSSERYNEIVNKVSPFLKQCGFGASDVQFMPISGYTGANVKSRLEAGVFDYNGPSLLEFLNSFGGDLMANMKKPFIMPVSDKIKDMGVFIAGKIASGVVKKNDLLLLMPIEKQITVQSIEDESGEIQRAKVGDNIRIKVKGVEEEDVFVGFIACSVDRPIHAVNKFEAQLVILELKNIITSGYTAVMHLGNITTEIAIHVFLINLGATAFGR
eukprot:NODE_622_length_5917_cov_0.361464.p2 type:complete len:503 gc:universal NODE_622_length_5917_cov_0.361464:3966-2458(-)